MVKLQETPTGQFIVTIPKQLAKLKSWKKGSKISFKDHGKGSIILYLEGEENEG